MSPPSWEVRDGDARAAATLSLGGRWVMGAALPDAVAAARALRQAKGEGTARLAADAVEAWDTTLLVFLRRLETEAQAAGTALDRSGLPDGVAALLAMASATGAADERADRAGARLGAVAQLGAAAISAGEAAVDAVRFVGEVAIAAAGAVRRGRGFRPVDLMTALATTGVEALPIVTLIGLLVGMILAFIGAIQLAQFGAELYVANLVALGMLREMGAMMAAVIMAGRTGAAFAAELGTMQVNEETDALLTAGFAPVAFLVLPRLLALTAMMPLLAIYANLWGIAGGALVGVAGLGIAAPVYFDQTLTYIGPHDLVVGLVKALAFAAVVGLTGCYHGMRCGRSSAAVGRATTAAVVSGIVGIVVVDAALTVVFYVVGL